MCLPDLIVNLNRPRTPQTHTKNVIKIGPAAYECIEDTPIQKYLLVENINNQIIKQYNSL